MARFARTAYQRADSGLLANCEPHFRQRRKCSPKTHPPPQNKKSIHFGCLLPKKWRKENQGWILANASFFASLMLASRQRHSKKERTTFLFKQKCSPKTQPSTNKKGHPLVSFFVGGGWWIRTTEVSDNRFTVCPLWPLGNSPASKRKIDYTTQNTKCQASFFENFKIS